jgi:hypothetical protein
MGFARETGQELPLGGKAATAVAESLFSADRGPKMGHEQCGAGHDEESAEQAQKKTPKGSQIGMKASMPTILSTREKL